MKAIGSTSNKIYTHIIIRKFQISLCYYVTSAYISSNRIKRHHAGCDDGCTDVIIDINIQL